MVAKQAHAPRAAVERKVLLAIREGHLDPRLLNSARSLCQRLDAELDILLLAAAVRFRPRWQRWCATCARRA